MSLNSSKIIEQSKSCYNQWKEVWRKNAKIHSKLAPFKNLADYMNSGVGKACLIVANGFSLEENMHTIKAHAGNVDILCCDKTLGHLIRNGIKPTYVMVCDAIVDYEKYLKPYEKELDQTTLFINVCANPEWSQNGNWKKVVGFVNHDSIRSEIEFMKISKCQNQIAAATNVSNAMVVFLTQSDNSGRKNFFGYDKILLIGFDYSWRHDGKYYAYDESANGKANYMRHVYLVNKRSQHCYSSTNLMFSAQWLEKYVNNFQLPVIQCSQDTILSLRYNGALEDHIQYRYKSDDYSKVRAGLELREIYTQKIKEIEQTVHKIGEDHYFNMLATL